MSSLGKATLHLYIANFMFSHTFIICDNLLDKDILFDIDIQKIYCLSYNWDSDKQLLIQREGSFLIYTRKYEQQHDLAIVKSPLKYHLGTMTSYQSPSKYTILSHNGIPSPVINMSTGDLIQKSM